MINRLWELGMLTDKNSVLKLNAELFAIELAIDRVDELIMTPIRSVHFIGKNNTVMIDVLDLLELKKKKIGLNKN